MLLVFNKKYFFFTISAVSYCCAKWDAGLKNQRGNAASTGHQEPLIFCLHGYIRLSSEIILEMFYSDLAVECPPWNWIFMSDP